MKIGDRLRRLEDAAVSARNGDATKATDAALVLRMVERIAGRFPASAAAIPLVERIAKMSPAEHCAWEMRFAQEQTPIASIMVMHGRPFPTSHAQREYSHAPR
jgi:hypothetical protein